MWPRLLPSVKYAVVSTQYYSDHPAGPIRSSLASSMSTITLPRAISHWRFTLSGLLLFMLSISVGLAWWRVPGATVGQFLLGCFAAWFFVGMVQRSREAYRLASEVRHSTTAIKLGLATA